MKKEKPVAIILARGGSSRIPHKNIVDFLGKPLMGRVIEACQNAGIFDRILVSTDDDAIAGVASKYGLKTPFKREFYNTDGMHTDMDGNPIVELTELDKHYFNKFESCMNPLGEYCLEKLDELLNEQYDSYCTLPANTPFLTAAMIADLYEVFEKDKLDYAYTLARCGKHPWFYVYGQPPEISRMTPWMWEKDGKKLAPRTQDMPETYQVSAPFFFKANCQKEPLKTGFALQNWEASIDIDTYEDLTWCEQLASGLDNR